jgi:rubrerythrin
MKFFSSVDSIVRVASLVCAEHCPRLNDDQYTRDFDEAVLALRDAILDFQTGVETLEWASQQVIDRAKTRWTASVDIPKSGESWTCFECSSVYMGSIPNRRGDHNVCGKCMTIGDSPKTGDTCTTCLGGGTRSGHPDDPENCPDCDGTGEVPLVIHSQREYERRIYSDGIA